MLQGAGLAIEIGTRVEFDGEVSPRVTPLRGSASVGTHLHPRTRRGLTACGGARWRRDAPCLGLASTRRSPPRRPRRAEVPYGALPTRALRGTATSTHL